jgi:hypothetical protein
VEASGCFIYPLYLLIIRARRAKPYGGNLGFKESPERTSLCQGIRRCEEIPKGILLFGGGTGGAPQPPLLGVGKRREVNTYPGIKKLKIVVVVKNRNILREEKKNEKCRS